MGVVLAILHPCQEYMYFNQTRQWGAANEWLCVLEPRLRLKRFGLERGSKNSIDTLGKQSN